jgi:hypothetical protein
MSDSEIGAAVNIVYDELIEKYSKNDRVPVINLFHEVRENLSILGADLCLATRVLSQLEQTKFIKRDKKEYVFQ